MARKGRTESSACDAFEAAAPCASSETAHWQTPECANLGTNEPASAAGAPSGGMPMPRFRWLRAGFVAGLLAVVVVPQPAWSQSGAPSGRTIKVIISVPPGGTIDFLVRVLADQIGKASGPTIIVESRPGAGSLIAAEAV